MKCFISLIIFFSINLCAIAESVHLEAEVIEDEYILYQFPAIFAVTFKAEFSSGEKMSGITLFQSTISGNRWLLQINPNFENNPSNKKSITINEYESLISSILEYISANEELRIDSINMKYYLVDSIRDSIVSAVKKSAQSRSGKINSTDMEQTGARAITAILQKSDIFDRTCSLLNKYLSKHSYYTCEAPQFVREGISFQLEFYGKNGKDWKDIGVSEEGGLSESIWLPITIKQNGVDLWTKPVR